MSFSCSSISDPMQVVLMPRAATNRTGLAKQAEPSPSL